MALYNKIIIKLKKENIIMWKKILSVFICSGILLTTALPTGTSAASLSELDCKSNANLINDDGSSLVDNTYQYSVSGDSYFAYMWVPEAAKHLNGVMIAKSNLIEGRLLESKTVRDVLAKYNIGVVYLHSRNTTKMPSENTVMGDFIYLDNSKAEQNNVSEPLGAGARIDEMMARFASVSGYDELKYAPLIGVGHSAGMGLGKVTGSWDPERTIAQICLKSGTALTAPGVSGSSYAGDNYEIQPGVPTYLAAGQFTEHASYNNPAGKDNYIDGEISKLKNIRAKGTDRLITMSVEWEAGHYDWSEYSNEMVAEYLDSIIPARLGAQATSQEMISEEYELLDLTKSGYVSDVKMYGSRTLEYEESEYSHGNVGDFSDEELKSMVWFPDESVYKSIRNFTQNRKELDVEEVSGEVEYIYTTIDKAFEETTGNPNWWQGDLHYIQVTGDGRFYDIMVGFDLSKMSGENPEQIKLSMTRTPGAGGYQTDLYLLEQNPWANGAYDATVVAGVGEPIATYDGNSCEIDVTKAIGDRTGEVYFLLRYTNRTTEQAGNDYYCETGAGYNSEATNDSQRPRLIVNYSAPETVNKHQYLQMADPTTLLPKAFTRITRYDGINPNNSSYADGIENDKMTFSMYIDKMNVVSPDHIGAGTAVKASDTPAFLTPVMAPVEWVGVKKAELSADDISNNVASKWMNVLRWKNNRVYYRNPSQDSYINLDTADVYNGDELEFSYATNAFMINPLFVNGGKEQHITMPEIADVDKDFTGFEIAPYSSADLTVDVMVEYGPVKAVQNSDGSYTVVPCQIPLGASYPIECKLVATQFGVNNNGTKINTALPVERVFYITDETECDIPLNGEINQNALKQSDVTGFNVTGSGTITLKMDCDTAFSAERAAQITAERTNTTDAYYAKHYKYPEGYNPYDYWEDYPCEWSCSVEGSGFVPLTDFVNRDGKKLNLNYVNVIETVGIESINAVTAQTEIVGARAMTWGNGVNIVWQSMPEGSYDSVNVYVKDNGEYKKVNAVCNKTNALVTGFSDGEYEFKITTVKGQTESSGVIVKGKADISLYELEDFETGDLTSGMNLLSNQESEPVYSWISQTGAALDLFKTENNSYLGMQNNYTSSIQTVNINIPGGLNSDMSSIELDILVDKLENTQSSGQVYFELFNPTSGKSYGVEKGSDFALEDKEWHEAYSVPLTSFALPSSEKELSQITVLKIGRKTVGGGNNNRRAKIYLDNISFIAEEGIPTKKLMLSADYVMADNSSLPNGATINADALNIIFDGETSDKNVYQPKRQKRVYLDLGKEYRIDKIVITEYGLKNGSPAGTVELAASTVSPQTMAGGSFDNDLYLQLMRTNGTSKGGVTVVSEDILENGTAIGRTTTAYDVYTNSKFETVRYIEFCDWSNDPSIAELEIYVLDEPIISFDKLEITQSGVSVSTKVVGDANQDVKIYIAEYDNTGINKVLAVADETITQTKEIPIPCITTAGKSIKAFIWDDVQAPVNAVLYAQ